MKDKSSMKLTEYRFRIIACIIVVAVLVLGFQLLRMGTVWDNSKNTVKMIDDGQTIRADQNRFMAMKQDRVLLMFDGKDELSVKTKDNMQSVITHMKKKVDIVDVGKKQVQYKDYSSVLIVTRKLDQIKNAELLRDYIFLGGSLFIGASVEHDGNYYYFSQMLGIFETGIQKMNHGVVCQTDFIFGSKGQTFSFPEDDNFSTTVRLVNSARVHLKTKEGNPLLWEMQSGKGKIMMFNGNRLSDKRWHGVIAAVVSQLKDEDIYPVIGSKVIMLSYFPSPLSGDADYIQNTYETDIPNFIRKIWWRDLRNLSKQYQLKYTCFPVLNYLDYSTPPYDVFSTDKNMFISYNRELLAKGGEIGLTSYHQQPHVDASYQGKIFGFSMYKTYLDLLLSLKAAKKYFNDAFPHYTPRCYLPPANIMSKQSMETVLKAEPGIKVISGLYFNYGNPVLYANDFRQYEDGSIGLPRLTFGYPENDLQKWGFVNGANAFGLINHEINPLSLMWKGQTSWQQLFQNTQALFGFCQKQYGVFDAETASQAAEKVRMYDMVDLRTQIDGKKISVICDRFVPKTSFVFRTIKKIDKTQGCKLTQLSDTAYYVVAENAQFSITTR